MIVRHPWLSLPTPNPPPVWMLIITSAPPLPQPPAQRPAPGHIELFVTLPLPPDIIIESDTEERTLVHADVSVTTTLRHVGRHVPPSPLLRERREKH